MGIVYQLTFFMGLGLIALVIAIFVLATSQVGKATESAAKEQEEMLSEQKKAKEKQILVLTESLNGAKEAGHLDERKFRDDLDSTRKEMEGYNVEIEQVQKMVVLLRRKGAVVYPGISFIVTLVLSMIASGLNEGVSLSTIALWLWIISIGTLVFGVYRMFLTLGAIEKVTINSGEAMHKLPEALKSALMQMEEENKPELELTFPGETPPFGFKVGEERTIDFRLSLTKGNIARGIKVIFFAPPGFDFPGRYTQIQSGDVHKVAGYISAFFEWDSCNKAIALPADLNITAPDKAKRYTLLYSLSCDEGFCSTCLELKVKVE